MGSDTKIQWADHTFNPWRGCSTIATGCANCYAEALSKRNPATLGVWGPSGTRVVASEAMWRQPIKWDRAAAASGRRDRVFCASLADVFEDWPGAVFDAKGNGLFVDEAEWFTPGVGYLETSRMATLDDVRSRLFRLIDSASHLDWLLLTKRPENIRRMIADVDQPPKHGTSTMESVASRRRLNLWLGVSIACQDDADRLVPELLKCRDLAAKLFLSIEPLVGAVTLVDMNIGYGPGFSAIGNRASDGSELMPENDPDFRGASLDFVIVGGESGPNARPCNIEWIRSIVRQCRDAGVPCFVKQLGACVATRLEHGDEWPGGNGLPTDGDIRFSDDGFGNYAVTGLRDPKGGDPAEWPEDLRVREVPS